MSPITLARGDELLFYPSLGVGPDGRIYVVLIFNNRVNLFISGDGGITWSEPVALSGEAKQFSEPVVQFDAGGGLNVVWAGSYKRRYFTVYFTRSVDKGATWTVPVSLFNGWDDCSYAHAAALASDAAGGLFVTWTAWSEYGKNQHGSVFANYSHNRGASWNYTDASFGVSWFSDIAFDPAGGSVYAAVGKILPGYDYRIVLLESGDRGISWNREEIVTTGGDETRPRMVIDAAGNINLVYLSWDGYYFTRSLDGGVIWSDRQRIFQDAADARMAVDSQGNLYFVCEDQANARLYFRRSVF